jgi:hypothetical protein
MINNKHINYLKSFSSTQMFIFIFSEDHNRYYHTSLFGWRRLLHWFHYGDTLIFYPVIDVFVHMIYLLPAVALYIDGHLPVPIIYNWLRSRYIDAGCQTTNYTYFYHWLLHLFISRWLLNCQSLTICSMIICGKNSFRPDYLFLKNSNFSSLLILIETCTIFLSIESLLHSEHHSGWMINIGLSFVTRSYQHLKSHFTRYLSTWMASLICGICDTTHRDLSND